MNNSSSDLSGIIAATYTAFHADGSLNLDAIEKQAAILSEDGATGAFICGTTGEGLSLSSAERMQVAERWRAVVQPGSLKIVVHVGHNSLVDAINLAKHSEKIGVDAISIAAPNYFKASSVEALLTFCSPVASAAPNLPFYYYEIPAMTGVSVSMTDFLGKGGPMIPNLAGLKFSSTNLAVLQECRAFQNERYNILFGCDEMLLAALALGIRGAVGSTYNYATPLYHKMIAAFDAGNFALARRLQLRSVEMVNAIQPFGVLAAGKALMACRGIDCGPVRSPLEQLSDVRRKDLFSTMEKSGFIADGKINWL